MRKLLLTSIVLCLATMMLSARKPVHPIVGEWEESSITTEYYENDKLTDTQTVTFDIYDNYWVFKKNGKFISKDNYGKHKGKWAVSGDLLKIEEKSISSKYFTIVEVSVNTLKIKVEEKVFDRTIATISTYRKKF